MFWSSVLLNTDVISFHGSDCESGEFGEAFAHNDGGQCEVLQQRPLIKW